MHGLLVRLAVLALLLPALSGCFTNATTAEEGAASQGGGADKEDTLIPVGNETFGGPPQKAVEPPVTSEITLDGVTYRGGNPALWNGSVLTGSGKNPNSDPQHVTQCIATKCPEVSATCGDGNCERRAFNLSFAEGFWDTHEGAVEVSARWPTDPRIWFTMWVEDADGKVVAKGVRHFATSLAAVALLEKPASGTYHAVVVAVSGTSSYEGVVQVEARPRSNETRELLPNLVVLPPTDLRIQAPNFAPTGPAFLVPVPAGVLTPVHNSRGCVWDEIAAGAKRCLRFSSAIGNAGEGDLLIRLTLKDGATSATEGRFAQRVYNSDGTFTDVPAGRAEWHAAHSHWHDAASNEYVVYAYDLETGTRGDVVNKGHKAGICFADVGLVALDLPHTGVPRHGGFECWNAVGEKEWHMGLSPGWYDLYSFTLSDQYVDLGDAPDGVYQLCNVANQLATLRESDPTDNEGCTVFRLKGDTVEPLSPRPYHEMPSDLKL